MSEKKPFKFAAAKKSSQETLSGSWKILVVDDEEEVHSITRSVLRNFTYNNRNLEFLDAYSGAEAKQVMSDNPSIAVILLDVVMESDDAGLEVARYVREDLKNRFTQIILRTGQPGSAPEKSVIMDYEINDYKEKTELTATKLFTVVLTALRAYKNIMSIEKNRAGLEKIIDSTRTLLYNQNERKFIEGVLMQMEALLHLDDDSLLAKHSGFSAIHKNNDEFNIVACTGQFKNTPDLINDVREALDVAIQRRTSYFDGDIYVGYFYVESDIEHLIYFQGCSNLSEDAKKMVDIFASKVAIALENFYLNKEIVETKREIINTLGNVVESRSKETAYHVQRMAEISYFLAQKYGVDDDNALTLKYASPLHDVGKVGIPDNILLKPGRLTPEEFQTMKQHAQIGYDILKSSNRDLIKTAATIAYQHHERFDGTGYPQGLKGEEIHLYGRITAVADVFDALYYKRCYKEPWPLEDIIAFFQKERGKAFDPVLTDIFLENIDTIVEMNKNLNEG